MKFPISALLSVGLVSALVVSGCVPSEDEENETNSERGGSGGGTVGSGGSGGGSGGSSAGGASGGSSAGGAMAGQGGSDEPMGGSGGAAGGAGGADAGIGGAGGAMGGAGGAMGGAGGAMGGAGGAMGGAGGAMGGAGGAMGGAGGAMGGAGGGNGNPSAPKMAVAHIMPLPGGMIMGRVTFVEVAGGVQVTYDISNCPPGNHPTHIHQGSGCGSVGQQGMHWDPPRGERIGSGGGQISCDSSGRGRLTYTRQNNDADLRWTIGDGSNTDVVGHPVLVHGINNANQRHGCGVIRLAQ